MDWFVWRNEATLLKNGESTGNGIGNGNEKVLVPGGKVAIRQEATPVVEAEKQF